MEQASASMEIFRWGFAHLPGAIFFYAPELDLEMEDIGIIAAIFYAFEKTKPLFQSGVTAGQVLQYCPILTTHKLSRRLTKLIKNGIIEIIPGDSKYFNDKVILLEPIIVKLSNLIIRDHPQFRSAEFLSAINASYKDEELQNYQEKIMQLELQLEEEKNRPLPTEANSADYLDFKKVADFIAKKSGNLLSLKMESELRKWLQELGFTTEFLLCVLEMTFERNIVNPREITRIARDLKEYSINTVEGLESYFINYVDKTNKLPHRVNQFDPDIIDFGSHTGIDMNAEARKKVYYKWKYDWGFSHEMIMKAGEIMCQRTKNGGLEYIDSVLNNWMSKKIRTVADAEKQVAEFKIRNKAATSKTIPATGNTRSEKRNKEEYKIYVPPEVLEELKSNA